MNKWISLLLTLIFVFLLPGSVAAFKTGFLDTIITNSFTYNYNKLAETRLENGEFEEKPHQFLEELFIFSKSGNFSIGLTLREYNFYTRTQNSTLEKAQFDLYRKYIQYSGNNIKINAGDFYAMLGRGLTLAISKNEGAFRERTILGGDISFDKGAVNFRGLSGLLKNETNNQEWYVSGGEAILKIFKNTRFGGHGSFVRDKQTSRMLGDRITYGASFRSDNLFNMLSIYAEGSMLDFKSVKRKDGNAVYSNFTFNKLPVTVSVEYKKYENFDNEVNNPPTADREEEAASIISSEGLRVYTQYSIMDPDIIFFVNWGRYLEFKDRGDHLYGGFMIEDLWDFFSLSATYGKRDIHYPVKKIDASMVVQLTDHVSLQLFGKDKRYEDGTFYFHEQDLNAELSFAPTVSLFGLYQYSYNMINNRNKFYSGGVKLYIGQAVVFEVSGGTIRGGQVCAGGQCFVIPPFEGIKFGLITTFR